MSVVTALRLLLQPKSRWQVSDDTALRERERQAEEEALKGLRSLRDARPAVESEKIAHLKKDIADADALVREALGR